jgi:hypothetical protein
MGEFVDMNADSDEGSVDVGAFCRAVETHLTRVNGGHLMRIVGPGFEVVRRWATDGMPLSVVFRGIDVKAMRHHAGTSRRPLRIEFCEDDVRAEFDAWRRAVGVAAGEMPAPEAAPGGAASTPEDDAATAGPAAARRAATKDLDRAIERLSRAAGRVDWPDALRAAVSARLMALTEIREAARGARGDARVAVLARVAEGDAAFGAALRASAPADAVGDARREASRDLAAYRGRLAPAAWEQAVDLAADRLLRTRLGLPT